MNGLVGVVRNTFRVPLMIHSTTALHARTTFGICNTNARGEVAGFYDVLWDKVWFDQSLLQLPRVITM